MNVVNYSVHNIPADHRAIIYNIYAFALAQGWTIDEWRDGYTWSSGWAAGNGCFLQLYSPGYGSQGTYNQYRIYSYYINPYVFYKMEYPYATVTRGAVGVIEFGQHNRMYSSYSNIANNPTLQNTLLYRPDFYGTGERSRLTTANHTAMVKQWIFGNSNFIYTFIQIDAFHCIHFYFGIPELFNTSYTNGQMFCVSSPLYSTGMYNGWAVDSWDYYTTKSNIPVVVSTMANNVNSGYSGTALNIASLAYTNPTCGDLYTSILKINSWSGKRVMIQPMIWANITATGNYQAVGLMPYGVLDISGLAIGETVTYGTETYLTFPVYGQTIGYAFRIA